MARMQQLYLEKWTAKWSTASEYDQLKQAYSMVLARLSGEEIAAGIEACIRDYDWPPTPAEFFQAAKRASEKPIGPAYRVRRKELPRPPEQIEASRRAAFAHIENIRQELDGRKTDDE